MRYYMAYNNLSEAPLELLPPAPILLDFTVSAITATTVDLTVETTQYTGYVHLIIALATATAPTAEQLIAGTDGDDVDAVWVGTIASMSIDTMGTGPSGLTTATSYKAYAVHRDAFGNKSQVMASPTFTTL